MGRHRISEVCPQELSILYPWPGPEMINVMAIEGLWVSPGGKTPASTLYTALSRSIKHLGKSSPFRKTEWGKFEAME